MKIQLASDLHLEFLAKKWPNERLIDPCPDADILVLAGDIDNGTSALKHFSNWPVPVIYVVGNHEFYKHSLPEMREQIRMECTEHGITFLDNNMISLGEIRILGCTLWTDYRLPGINATQSQQMDTAGSRINDHALIQMGGKNFTPVDALQLHEESRNWLKSVLAQSWNGITVVVTHHAPHPDSTASRFSGDTLNGAYMSDLSELMPAVDLWLHGHVHDSFDYAVGGCRIVANPTGYLLNRGWAIGPEEFQFENRAWQRNLIIET